MSMINDPKNLDRFDQNQLSVYSRGHFLHVKIRPPEYKFLCFILEPSISVCYRNRAFAVLLEGSTFSGGNRLYTRGNMTSQWKQLYLSRAKLKAVSRTSALFAGFAMVAMVEVQLDSSVKYDPTLLIMFSAVTTCLVAVHLFALMISTCMLPNIEAVSNIHHAKAIEQSPHRRMRTYIEVAWILSTGVGLILFMIEIGLLIWLKFTSLKKQEINSDIPAWVATAVLIPVVFFFVAFAVYFYRSLAEHKYTMFKDAVNELEMLGQEVQTGGNFSMLHPGTMEDGYHRSVSRMPSGMSMQSQQENQTTTAHELQVPSQASSLSGHFSVDAC